MGKWCCVLDCRESRVKDRTGKKISYHRLPPLKKEALRKEWLRKTRRRDYFYKSTQYVYVCSKHFTKEDFRLKNPREQPLLKASAVPSIFNWDYDDVYTTRNLKVEAHTSISNDQRIIKMGMTPNIRIVNVGSDTFMVDVTPGSSDVNVTGNNQQQEDSYVSNEVALVEEQKQEYSYVSNELALVEEQQKPACACVLNNSLEEENKILKKTIADLEMQVARQKIELRIKEVELNKSKKTITDLELQEAHQRIELRILRKIK